MTPINADAHRPVARVEQTFTAPPDVVYDALLNASVLFDCFNSSGALGAAQTMVRVTLDARVGGTYDIVDRSARSGEEVSHSGIYLELQLGERIAFSWSVPAYDTHDEQVTIDILPGDAGARSVVTLAHTMQPEQRPGPPCCPPSHSTSPTRKRTHARPPTLLPSPECSFTPRPCASQSHRGMLCGPLSGWSPSVAANGGVRACVHAHHSGELGADADARA